MLSENGGRALKWISDNQEILGDKEMVLLAIDNGDTIENINESLKDDDEVMSKAIAKRASNFKYASPRLKQNISFVQQALAENWNDTYELLSEETKARPEVIRMKEEREKGIKDKVLSMGAEALMYPQRVEELIKRTADTSMPMLQESYFELMQDLENGTSYDDMIQKMEEDTDRYRYAEEFLLDFAKQGPEFYEYYKQYHGKRLNQEDRAYVEKKKQENSKLAEEERQGNLHDIGEVAEIASDRTETELSSAMSEIEEATRPEEQIKGNTEEQL